MTLLKPADPLLNGAKIIIVITYAILIFAITMVSIGAAAILTVGKAQALTMLAEAGVPPEAIWPIFGAMMLIIILLGIAYKFMRVLHGIINSVGDGDPFAPENADRLSKMGWLALAGQLVVLPLAAVERWFHPYLEKAGRHGEIGFGFDIGTVLLILILFILARVFRKGAAMQEELEGTV